MCLGGHRDGIEEPNAVIRRSRRIRDDVRVSDGGRPPDAAATWSHAIAWANAHQNGRKWWHCVPHLDESQERREAVRPEMCDGADGARRVARLECPSRSFQRLYELREPQQGAFQPTPR